MTKVRERFFRHAKHVAEMSSFRRVKVGCVVAYKGKVLSSGFNTYKTHPLQLKYNRYRDFNGLSNGLPAALHAEISALSLVVGEDIDWSKVDVYVCRLRRDQPYGLAAPCPACRRLMEDLGVRSVLYSTDDGFCQENIIKGEY